jgi:hypothetical protein
MIHTTSNENTRRCKHGHFSLQVGYSESCPIARREKHRRGEVVQLHPFLTLALDARERSISLKNECPYNKCMMVKMNKSI